MHLRRMPQTTRWGPESLGGQADADFAKLYALGAKFDGTAKGGVAVAGRGGLQELADLRGVPDAAAECWSLCISALLTPLTCHGPPRQAGTRSSFRCCVTSRKLWPSLRSATILAMRACSLSMGTSMRRPLSSSFSPSV